MEIVLSNQAADTNTNIAHCIIDRFTTTGIIQTSYIVHTSIQNGSYKADRT